MSTPVTPTSAPASTPAPGSPPSVWQWIPSILLLGLIYIFLAAQIESPSTLSMLAPALPLVAALSLVVRILSGNARYWHKAATAVMVVWLLGVIVPLFQRGELAATQAIYNQSERFGKSTDAAKERFYLNRSADVHPSLLAAREEVFEQTLQMHAIVAEKAKARLNAINKLYAEGRMSLEQWQTESESLNSRIDLADNITQRNMLAVKGPYAPPDKKPYPAPWGIPHWVWLVYVLVVGVIAYGLVHDNSAKLVTLLLAVVASLFCVRGVSWSLPDLSGISNFFTHLTDDFATIVICFIVLLFALGVIYSFVPKSSGGGSHGSH